jgi:hypothetical protein
LTGWQHPIRQVHELALSAKSPATPPRAGDGISESARCRCRVVGTRLDSSSEVCSYRGDYQQGKPAFGCYKVAHLQTQQTIFGCMQLSSIMAIYISTGYVDSEVEMLSSVGAILRDRENGVSMCEAIAKQQYSKTKQSKQLKQRFSLLLIGSQRPRDLELSERPTKNSHP